MASSVKGASIVVTRRSPHGAPHWHGVRLVRRHRYFGAQSVFMDSLPRIICGDANKTTLVSVSGVQVADHALAAASGLDQQDLFTQIIMTKRWVSIPVCPSIDPIQTFHAWIWMQGRCRERVVGGRERRGEAEKRSWCVVSCRFVLFVLWRKWRLPPPVRNWFAI